MASDASYHAIQSTLGTGLLYPFNSPLVALRRPLLGLIPATTTRRGGLGSVRSVESGRVVHRAF